MLLAGWFAGAWLFHGLLADGVLSAQLCDADGCCVWFDALLASLALLLPTSPAKMSLACDWSAADLAGLGGAF